MKCYLNWLSNLMVTYTSKTVAMTTAVALMILLNTKKSGHHTLLGRGSTGRGLHGAWRGSNHAKKRNGNLYIESVSLFSVSNVFNVPVVCRFVQGIYV